MIKVLHLLESFVTGGAENVVFELCRGLHQASFDSTVIAIRDGDMFERFSGVANVDVVPKRKGPDPTLLFRLRDRIRVLNVDVVHVVNGLTVVNYGVTAARLAGIPVVASVHGASHLMQTGFAPTVWRRMLKAADMRVAVSDDIRKRLKMCLGSDVPVQLVYNAIDELSTVPDPEFRTACFGEWGIPEDATVAVCVANLREVKGHKFLIQAVSRVVRTVSSFHLLLIGTGPLEASIREAAYGLGVESHIHFAGLRKDVPACLQLCDIFVLPSISEGTPLCLLEAMRAALPVVASRVGGIPEIVVDGVTGNLVPPEDPTVLATSILHLIQRPELSKRYGEQGRARLRNAFTLPLFLNRYAKLFEEVSAKRSFLCAYGVAS
ncbi:glycosyltransferase [Geomonas sp. RF6]|uniref:glycosyltransferase n=1 Tax=Geomonas sp. RF6 TaxID=2897342 RepID=UPI001E5CD862|nr:glycosyltransferase [Geomonas sp. RF6]UFS69115.1 glycosyltransferase [Geomonas sp. RF6]